MNQTEARELKQRITRLEEEVASLKRQVETLQVQRASDQMAQMNESVKRPILTRKIVS